MLKTHSQLKQFWTPTINGSLPDTKLNFINNSFYTNFLTQCSSCVK